MSFNMPLGYSLVIATFERAEDLRNTLSSILLQTRLPEQTIIVDSSRDDQTHDLVETFDPRLALLYERAIVASAAQQRNQGSLRATAPLIGFMDDDMVLAPETCAALCEVFDRDEKGEVGGVAARIDGLCHPVPKGFLWLYYRIQAGYADRTYGGQLFGPAINCLPSYSESTGPLIPAHWLNAGCVLYRRKLSCARCFPSSPAIASWRTCISRRESVRPTNSIFTLPRVANTGTPRVRGNATQRPWPGCGFNTSVSWPARYWVSPDPSSS